VSTSRHFLCEFIVFVNLVYLLRNTCPQRHDPKHLSAHSQRFNFDMADGYTYAGETSKGSGYSTVYDAEDPPETAEDDLTTLKLASKLAVRSLG
jgi:hypothetical protein